LLDGSHHGAAHSPADTTNNQIEIFRRHEILMPSI
jgi:hypothetical protein